MNPIRKLRYRLRALFRGAQLDRELDDEMHFHLEQQAREHIEDGAPPIEARRVAAVAFGGIERAREDVRDARGGRWFEDFARDVRHALRSLRRSPGFTTIAIVIFALGIAGNTVVFSLVNGLFLAPLPFPQPGRLVALDETAPKWNLRYTGINYTDFAAWREHNETFAGMAHWRGGAFSMAQGRHSERVQGQRVTHDLAGVLGIQPARGRMFRADEEMRGGPKVALIAHHIWIEWFGGSDEVIGQSVTIDAEVHEIIGVLPPSAVVPTRVAFWIPFDAEPRQFSGLAVGRLKPGVTVASASADLLRIHRARTSESKDNEITSPIVQPLLERLMGDSGVVAGMLQGAVVILLLIACANVAGLMLARTLGRVPELGLRTALGASRSRLVRQLVTESLLLVAAGSATGVLLGRWLLDGVLRLFPDLPSWIQLETDWRIVAFIGAVMVFCTVVAGLIPARRVLRRLDVRSVLGAGSHQATAPHQRVFALRALVVGEIGMALLLVLVAGMLGRAFLRVNDIDPGLRPDHMLTYALQLPEATYPNTTARLAFFEQHLARLRALPGVEAASASTVLPFSGQHIGNFFEPENGPPDAPDAKSPVVLTRMSFPGYLGTMGIPLRAGSDFDERDWHNRIIVNESLAQVFWPGENAVGKRMRSRGGKAPWIEVIGVAGDVRHYGLEGEVRPGVYVPFPAMPQSDVGIVIRTKGDPVALAPTVREILNEQDATLPVAGLATMEERIRQSLFLRRLYSGLTTTFAVVALAMAMTGLYGIIAYVAGQRTREYGIRLALGAQVRDLVRLVLRDGARLAAIGAVLGLTGGILAGFALSALLFGVSPLDPLVLLGATAFLAALVLVACLVPARRAARLNVVDVLRLE